MKTARVVALALPLALGSACAHQQTQGPAGAPRDPMMRIGPAVQAHAGDRVVVGRIASVKPGAVDVSTDNGDIRTLRIVPQTAIQLDGRDVSSAALGEGLPVRASFDVVSGQDVAVQVWAERPQLGTPSEPQDPGGTFLDEFGVPVNGQKD